MIDAESGEANNKLLVQVYIRADRRALTGSAKVVDDGSRCANAFADLERLFAGRPNRLAMLSLNGGTDVSVVVRHAVLSQQAGHEDVLVQAGIGLFGHVVKNVPSYNCERLDVRPSVSRCRLRSRLFSLGMVDGLGPFPMGCRLVRLVEAEGIRRMPLQKADLRLQLVRIGPVVVAGKNGQVATTECECVIPILKTCEGCPPIRMLFSRR